jgi:hypothetical protein
VSPGKNIKKPGAGPGLLSWLHETRATAYPAGMRDSGRRAREVMPAAMRALVSMTGWRAAKDMVRAVGMDRKAKDGTVFCRGATSESP